MWEVRKNPSLKILPEIAVTTEAGSVFQYLTILTEKPDSLHLANQQPWKPSLKQGRRRFFENY